MLDLVLDLFTSIILPAALTSAAVAALASWKLGWKGMEVAVPLAVAAGLLVGNWRRASIPYLPEDFGWEWMLACAVGALLVEVFKAFIHPNNLRLRGALVIAPIFVIAFLLMPFDWRSGLTIWAFAIVAALNSASFAAARPSHPVVAIIAVCCILGGASLLLLTASFARLCDAAVLLAASLAGLLVISRRPLPLRGLAMMIGMYVPGLMLNGYNQSFSEVPWVSYLLVAVSPMLFLIGMHRSLRRGPQWRRTTLEVALPLVVVAVGLTLGVAAEGGGEQGDWDPNGDWKPIEESVPQTPEPPIRPEPTGPEPVA